jgi:hypothetical protein
MVENRTSVLEYLPRETLGAWSNNRSRSKDLNDVDKKLRPEDTTESAKMVQG